MCLAANREAAVEREGQEVRAGKERRMAMAEEIQKLQLVRERLEGVQEAAQTYPEGHDMRTRLDDLHLERVIETIDGQLENLWDRTLYPRGT
jgi:hypothetical protein